MQFEQGNNLPRVRSTNQSSILRSLCRKGDEPSMAQILEAQRAGDADVYPIAERAVYTLGLAIANIDNFTCPHAMLIDGELFRSLDNRRILLDAAHRNICKLTRTNTNFVFVEPDALSGARGAAAVAVFHDLQTAAD